MSALVTGSLVTVGALTSVGASTLAHATTLHAVVGTSPSSAFVGQNVTADAHQSTLATGSGLRRANVFWGDGSSASALGSLAATATHRYKHAGHFPVKLTITDTKGRSSSATHVEVVTPWNQSVYWDLFNGSNPSYMLEYARLPLAKSSAHSEISGTVANKLVCTSAMTTDTHGHLWVISYPNGCSAPSAADVEVFTTPLTPSSAPVMTFNLPGTGDVDHLAFDHSGNLWVSDDYNKSVSKFLGPFTASRALSAAVTLSAGLGKPSGLALDAKGDLFVANLNSTGANSIAVFHAPVSNSTVPTHLNGLYYPGGLTVDATGNLYGSSNSSSHGSSIVRYSTGHMGRGALPTVVDKTGLTGKPYSSDFAWDAFGNLYVADCGSQPSIRKYPLATLAFSAKLAPSVNYTNASITSIGCVWGIAIR